MVFTRIWLYCTRIIPFLSVCCLLTLLTLSLDPQNIAETNNNVNENSFSAWQSLLACYIVLLHLLSTIPPARMFYATGKVMNRIQESVSSTLLTTPDPTELTKEGQDEVSLHRPIFVIIIPSYKEHKNTLEATLRVLASHPLATKCYHIYLAMEEREQGSIEKAKTLVSLFQKRFLHIDYCVHPSALPGEVPGKGSNENWAYMQVCNDYSKSVRRDVIVTTMDADTHLSWRYFAQIRKLHISMDGNARDEVIYLPPLVFDRNLHQVPLLVRLADIMWAGAGISSMYPSSRVVIPTSVYSLPMSLIELVGGWDVDSGAIGEDMHMYMKCFFALSGRLKPEVVYAAASQCNIASPYNGFLGYFDCMIARYQQALRHMWGALDSGYAIRRFCHTIHLNQRSCIEEDEESRRETYEVNPNVANGQRMLTLFHRMFEAHFLPTHLVLTLMVTTYSIAKHPTMVISYGLRLALEISSWLRTAGFCLMICYFYRYQQYHRLCVRLRSEEMLAVGLLKPLTKNDDVSADVFLHFGILESLLFPMAGLIFGAVAALQAMVSHVFTDRLVYVVSMKSSHASYCAEMTGKR